MCKADSTDRSSIVTILVVDDYAPNVGLLRRWLLNDGYEVLTASSGASALELIAQHQPNLILLDIEIPDPDGLAVCRRVRQDPATSEIPVIFLSGLDPSTVEARARSVGADDYLTKPIGAYKLQRCVRALLERNRTRSIPGNA
jgi:two-component system cell cycle response regulator